MTWYWHSFADDDRGGFLGVVITEHDTDDIVEQAITLWSRGLNPGGQLITFPIPPEELDTIAPTFIRNRILTREEVLGSTDAIRLGDHFDEPQLKDEPNNPGRLLENKP